MGTVEGLKMLILHVLGYACPLWNPAAKTHIEKLQRVQNSALRVATGCVNMTAIQHMHDECQLLPVRRHNRMRCVQQLMNHIPSHPGNQLLKQVPPPRNMKQTLKSRYERYIEALREPDSDDEISSKTRYQKMLKQIHTNDVKDYLDEREPNKVLDEKPPEISTKETLLPRRNGYSLDKTVTAKWLLTLSQLVRRMNWHSRLRLLPEL